MAAPPLTRPPGSGAPARGPQLRSPLARAVVPVLGGMLVLALIFLATWGMAVLISRGDADSSERLVPTEFVVGGVESLAAEIEDDGPIVFPDLDTSSGTRTVVLDHEGDDPTRGWVVYWGYRAGDDPSCDVTQVDRHELVHRLRRAPSSTSPSWRRRRACGPASTTAPP